MAIAANAALSNRKHTFVLPPAVETLADLSKLPEDKLEIALAEGWVRRFMAIASNSVLANGKHTYHLPLRRGREAIGGGGCSAAGRDTRGLRGAGCPAALHRQRSLTTGAAQGFV